MKTLVLGDIHGHDSWEYIVSRECNNVDRIIFLGDYFDSFTIDPKSQLVNFKKILDFKNDCKKEVVLLLGNHDWHYINNNERYSGKNEWTAINSSKLLLDCFDDRIFNLCFIDNNIVFSHAGISNTWLNKWCDGDVINCNLDFINYNALDFTYGSKWNVYGDCKESGPLWIRPYSLLHDWSEKIKYQVVGHTHNDSLTVYDNKLYICDCIENNYLIIDEEKFIIKDSKL